MNDEHWKWQTKWISTFKMNRQTNQGKIFSSQGSTNQKDLNVHLKWMWISNMKQTQTVKEHAGSAASVSQMIKMWKLPNLNVFLSFQVSRRCQEPGIGLTIQWIYSILSFHVLERGDLVPLWIMRITDVCVGRLSPHNELDAQGFRARQMTLGIYCRYSIQAWGWYCPLDNGAEIDLVNN